MPVIVVANPKGGVGKSTLATNLAGWFARQGHATMLGDTDRQQSSRALAPAASRGVPADQRLGPTRWRRHRASAEGYDACRARLAGRPARQAPRRADEDRRQVARAAAAEPVRHPGDARLHRRAAAPSPRRQAADRHRRHACARSHDLQRAAERLPRDAAGAGDRLAARHAELRAPCRARPDAVGHCAEPGRARPRQWEPLVSSKLDRHARVQRDARRDDSDGAEAAA